MLTSYYDSHDTRDENGALKVNTSIVENKIIYKRPVSRTTQLMAQNIVLKNKYHNFNVNCTIEQRKYGCNDKLNHQQNI